MADEVKDPTPTPEPTPVDTPPAPSDPDDTEEAPVVDAPPTPPAPPAGPPPISEETEYKLPHPTVDEHYFQHAAVVELRRLRIAVEAVLAVLLPGDGVIEITDDVPLKEPAKAKPKRG